MITFKGIIKLGFSETDFVLQDDGNGVYIRDWNSKLPQPSVEEIEKAEAEWQAEYDALQYQRDRQYPNLGEQLDMLFHDMTAGKGTKDGEWHKAIAKDKSDNPKE